VQALEVLEVVALVDIEILITQKHLVVEEVVNQV